MKKFKIIIIMLFVMISLSGCNCNLIKDSFYKDDILENLNLTDLPKPKYKYVDSSFFHRAIFGNIDENEFELYAKEVLDYLYSNFDYVGTIGDAYDRGDDLYYFIQCENELEDYYFEFYDIKGIGDYIEYNFIYFNVKDAIQGDRTDNIISLTYYKNDMTIGEKAKDKYNFRMNLTPATVFHDEYLINIEYDFDVMSDEDFELLYENAPKLPLHYLNVNLEGYERIVSSASSVNEAIQIVTDHFTSTSYHTTKVEVLYENDILYGIYVRWDPIDGKGIGYEENVVCFKKEVFDYDTFIFYSDDPNQIYDVLNYVRYSNGYNIDGTKILQNKFVVNDSSCYYYSYETQVIYGDYGLQDKVRLIYIEYEVNLLTNKVIKKEYIVKEIFIDGDGIKLEFE